jgi:ubiquinone biosynthesis protein
VSERGYSFAEILNQFIDLGRRYEIRMPREFLLVAKAFMAIESQARALDPAFNVITSFRSYVPRMIQSTVLSGWTRTSALGKGYRLAGDLQTILGGAADVLKNIVRQLQSGEATVRIRHDRLEELERHLDRASNRLSFSLIIAAIVIASSIVMTAHAGPHFEGVPVLGLLGYGIAAFLGLWWAIAILRSGKL